MGKIYLMSNGPDRVYVSCFDPALPPDQQIRPLTRAGIPLHRELDLYTAQFRARMLASLPEEDRQEPERWFVACSRDLFLSAEKEKFESILSELGYFRPKLVSDTDAVLAWYEGEQRLVSRLGHRESLMVLTLSQEGLRAERIRRFRSAEQNEDTADAPGTRALDEQLAELNLAEHPEDLLRFRQERSYRDQLCRQMWELRQEWLFSHATGGCQDPDLFRKAPEAEFPLHMNGGLLAKAMERYRGQVSRFLTRVQTDWARPVNGSHPQWGEDRAPVTTVLCNGGDWFLDALSETVKESCQGEVHLRGAELAVINGLENLAPQLAQARILEVQWRLLRQDSPYFAIAVDHMYQTCMAEPCKAALYPDQFVRKALEDWSRLQCRKDKLLPATLAASQAAQEHILWMRRTGSSDAYARVLDRTREQFLWALRQTHPAWEHSFAAQRLLTNTIRTKRDMPFRVLSHWMDNTPTCRPPLEDQLNQILERYEVLVDQLEDKPALLDTEEARAAQLSDLEKELWQMQDEVRAQAQSIFQQFDRDFFQKQPRQEVLATAFQDVQQEVRMYIDTVLGLPTLETYWFFRQCIGPVDSEGILALLEDPEEECV